MGIAKNKTQAKKLLKKLRLTPQHLSETTIQMVPTKLHANIPHKGSASDMRNKANSTSHLVTNDVSTNTKHDLGGNKDKNTGGPLDDDG